MSSTAGCPTCGARLPADGRFCPGCGATLARRCGRCDAELSPAARFCAACGERVGGPAAPAPPEPEGGERRQLTVLFCDLVGSTELSARLDPEDWQAVLRTYQTQAGQVVAHHGGHVAQYLGDGLLVYFGWPQAYDDAAERAVRAGLGLVDAAAAVTADGTTLAVRVGLHTGPVVVGALGGAGRTERLALGEVPNVAARVQGAAAPGTVVVSAATQRLVAGLFVVEERGAERLKGVPEPMVLYRVVQPSGVRSRLDVSVGRHTTFVGRQTELGVLRDAWERVVEGTGETILVQGEAGLGKSRLCYQLREQLTGEPHTWLECRCSPYTAATAFRPVTELVEQALAFQATDTPAAKLAKLGAGLARGGFAADETVPLLAEWLGLPEDAGFTPLAASPELKRRRTLDTLVAWNLKLGELQPMIVLVEDLHWCDPSSLELLGRLVAQSATARMLLVATARPEFASPWPARSNLQTVTLGRLTKRQAREMIAAVSAARALPEAVVAQLVERADGVPLFAEELTQAVVEAGGEASVAAIPVTLQDSLLARLDRLSSAKEVAQRAAVLGREFSYALLAATAGLDEGALQQGLARLTEAELVFVRGVPPEASYTFKHALVQEAAYESLLKRTRQQLHGRVADVLAAEFPERATSEPEVVARHAEAGGRLDEAVAWYGRAGEEAQARSAHGEAITQLRRAIHLLGTRPAGAERDALEVALQLMLAGSLVVARGYSHAETEAAYERARELAETGDDAGRLGMARIGLAVYSYTRGEIERGRALAAEVLAAAEARGDDELALHGHVQLGITLHYQGRFSSSLEHCEWALARYNPQRHHAVVRMVAADPAIAAQAYAVSNEWSLGRPDRALRRAREMVLLARRLGHPFSLAFALFFETVLHSLRGDWRAQEERGVETIALAETQGFPLWLAAGRAFHGAARVAAGHLVALPEIVEGLALAAETGNQGGASFLLGLLAEAQRATHQVAEAQASVAAALAVVAQNGEHFWEADLHRLDGDLLLASGGAADEAAARYRRALAIAREQGTPALQLRAATSFARLLRDQGCLAEARALLGPVHGGFTEGLDTGDLVAAKALLDELAS